MRAQDLVVSQPNRSLVAKSNSYQNHSAPYHIGLLNDVFRVRSKKNKSYSLRAYARDLGVSASHLVRVLSSKKNLSIELANEIQKRLELSPVQTSQFMNSVRDSASLLDEKSNRITLDQSVEISPEEFSKVSDWFYLAVLELTEITGYVVSELNVSRSLGIPIQTAALAIKRLHEMNLLKKTTTGYKKVNPWVHTGGRNQTNLALRLHQKSLLFKAAENLDSVPLEERANFGSMYAIDPSQIGEAKELINQFLLDLEKLLAGKNRTRVYATGIFLTPLSKIHNQK